ncbi:hypothetical protein KSS87_009099 [Heliosperma pusillum]|nr:hypothetical protein KSS87_009099 [Heliosperma pusillum]
MVICRFLYFPIAVNLNAQIGSQSPIPQQFRRCRRQQPSGFVYFVRHPPSSSFPEDKFAFLLLFCCLFASVTPEARTLLFGIPQLWLAGTTSAQALP